MATLMNASHEWATRPSDERFVSLDAMGAYLTHIRNHSRQSVVSSRQVIIEPTQDNNVTIKGGAGVPYSPTNWSFGQLANLSGAPAGYLRTLPAPLAADCINYGLKYNRDIEDIGVLLTSIDDRKTLRSANGPKYGRVWNVDIVNALRARFGNGLDGDFRVPGEFGKPVPITKANTTLFAGDRDMFIFLADEEHRIELPNRRNGAPGSLARGFFVWNSEEANKSLGIGTFLYDYVCCNRIVWGATEYKEIRIRHTVSAPDRFVEEVQPALNQMANSSTHNIVAAIEHARTSRLDDVGEWLQKRFSASLSKELQSVHMIEENRPIETLWDVTTALTAHARSVSHQDARVKLEREAGDIMAMAA